MRRKLTWVVLFSAAIGVTALYQAGKVSATPANSGFTSTSLTPVPGRFGPIDVFNHFNPPNSTRREHEHNAWLSFQKTKGDSDLYVQSNVWQPGGSTGWHTHLGHSLIIVTAGTVTAYEGDDPECKPHSYTAGMGFVDPGGGQCTSSGMKARQMWRRLSLSNSSQQVSRAELMLQTQGTAISEGRSGFRRRGPDPWTRGAGVAWWRQAIS